MGRSPVVLGPMRSRESYPRWVRRRLLAWLVALIGAPGIVVAVPAMAQVADSTAPPSPEPDNDATIDASVSVYVGYYDTHHHANLKTKPSPWKGSSNVVFVGTPDSGTSGGYDSACMRVDNLGTSSVTATVTVDIGAHHYALWGARSIPPGYRLILAQTTTQNFDGSDTNPAGCYGCNPNDCITKVLSTVPVVHVKIGTTTTNYKDIGQVLNTRGVDGAGCPYTGTRNDESHTWQKLSPSSSSTTFAGLPNGVVDQPDNPLDLAPATETTRPDLQVTPNPNHGYVRIWFRMPAPGNAHLGIYDVSGREVRMCLDAALEAGEYVDNAQMFDVKPGIYYCNLRTPETVVHKAFLVIR